VSSVSSASSVSPLLNFLAVWAPWGFKFSLSSAPYRGITIMVSAEFPATTRIAMAMTDFINPFKGACS
jgi:hypothetical protein